MSLGNRIAIIGNAGGGKSTLARKLGEILDLPVTHVDSIQYQSAWRRTPEEECDRKLTEIANGEKWILDGFGSDDVIASRINIADTVLFIDFPISLHYWWAFKRQLAARKGQRSELPNNCPEFTFTYTRKLIKVIWQVHKEYTPWFRELVKDKCETGNAVILRNPNEMIKFVREVEDSTKLHPNKALQSDAPLATLVVRR